MDITKLKEYLELATTIAGQAGEIMLKHFRADSLTTTWKAGNSPVTIADHEINRLVIDQVRLQYPEHGVIGEEESYEPERSMVWVVDPIDGTAMYDLGIPNSTFCLALVVGGDVQVSVVLDPYTERQFTALKGMGAFKNGLQFTTPQISDFKQTYAFIPTGSREDPMLFGDMIVGLKKRESKIMFIPSFSYLSTLVLEGSASVALMAYGSPWDAAAISLIATEAGCVATNLAGESRQYNEWSDGIVIANAGVSDYILGALKYANTRD